MGTHIARYYQSLFQYSTGVDIVSGDGDRSIGDTQCYDTHKTTNKINKHHTIITYQEVTIFTRCLDRSIAIITVCECESRSNNTLVPPQQVAEQLLTN